VESYIEECDSQEQDIGESGDSAYEEIISGRPPSKTPSSILVPPP
jgi:hypothetical protein